MINQQASNKQAKGVQEGAGRKTYTTHTEPLSWNGAIGMAAKGAAKKEKKVAMHDG